MDIAENIRVFCFHEKEQELEFFLKSALSNGGVHRYLLVFFNKKPPSSELQSILTPGFTIKTIKVPLAASAKWKAITLKADLDYLFADIPESSGHHNFFLDFSSIKVTKNLIVTIETSLIERVSELCSNFSVFSLFLEIRPGCSPMAAQLKNPLWLWVLFFLPATLHKTYDRRL